MKINKYNNNNNSICCICLEKMNDDYIILKCKHDFH